MKKIVFAFCVVVLSFAFCVLRSVPVSAQTSFSFGAGGDFGGSSDAQAVLAAIPGNVNMFFVVGDLAYSANNWCNTVRVSIPDTFPFELVAGNHDDDVATPYNIDTFVNCLPNKLSNLQGTYGKEFYVDHPSGSPLARFIMISPNLNFTNGGSFDYPAGSSRYQWVSSAIDSARSAGIPWVVIGMHENCIEMGVKNCSIGIDLMNLLVEKKVDLILQGHNHNYQRSKQFSFGSSCSALSAGSYNAGCVADDGVDNMYTKGKGPILVIAGTVGQGLYTINTSDSEAGYFAKWMGSNINPRKGFPKFTVSQSQIQAQYVGVGIGSFTDSFTIMGSGGTPIPTTAPSPTGVVTPTHGITPTGNGSPAPTCNPALLDSLSCFEVWRRAFMGEATPTSGDFNGDGRSTLADFELWRRSFIGV